MKKIFITLALCFFIGGCFDYKELNEMAIVGAMGIDYDIHNSEYQISIQLSDIKNSEYSLKETNSLVLNGTGKTLSDAMNKISSKSSRELYLGYMSMIIISENIGENYLESVLDFLKEKTMIIKNFNILVSKDCSPHDVLEIILPDENITSSSIISSLVTNDRLGLTKSISYSSFASTLDTYGIDAVLPLISLNNSSKEDIEDILVFKGLAVFKDKNIVGILDTNESIIYNILTNNKIESMITFKCDKNYASIKINKIKVKRHFENMVSYKIEMEVSLLENNCVDLENYTYNYFNNEVDKLIQKIQNNYKSDILGIGKFLEDDSKYENIKIITNIKIVFNN